jgi:hypothetical protein
MGAASPPSTVTATDRQTACEVSEEAVGAGSDVNARIHANPAVTVQVGHVGPMVMDPFTAWPTATGYEDEDHAGKNSMRLLKLLRVTKAHSLHKRRHWVGDTDNLVPLAVKFAAAFEYRDCLRRSLRFCYVSVAPSA